MAERSVLDREKAMAILKQYTKSDSLIKHALGVEAAMAAYARRFGEDETKWRVVGLLHDFDYEIHPTAQEHPTKGADMLAQMGYPEDIVYAVRAHGDHTGLERKSPMDKTLNAVDELTGFIAAVALVRPNKSLAEVEVSSVKKKMKDKAFARAVSREDMLKGAEALSIPFDQHVAFVIEAMQAAAEELGLAGTK